LVGRDVLIGILVGIGSTLLLLAQNQTPAWLGLPPATPLGLAEEALTHGLYYVLRAPIDAVMAAFTWCGLLFVLFLICRRGWLALGAALVLTATATAFTSEYAGVAVIYGLLFFALTLGVMLRFGLLAFVACYFGEGLLAFTPVTTDLSAWYAIHGLIPAGTLASLAVAAFVIARGGRPLFGKGWLDDE
jgi:hypothetical protein